jgi:hypothetical protein
MNNTNIPDSGELVVFGFGRTSNNTVSLTTLSADATGSAPIIINECGRFSAGFGGLQWPPDDRSGKP